MADPTRPMLDPTWTPAKGYAHALDLLRRLEQAEREKAAVKP